MGKEGQTIGKDYSLNLATAKRLIQKFGAPVDIIKFDGVSNNINEPWLGATDPVATGETISLYAVMVQPSSFNKLGFGALQDDLLKTSSLILIAEPGEDSPEDIDLFHAVKHNNIEYKIQYVEKLRPSTLTLLYFIGVSR